MTGRVSLAMIAEKDSPTLGRCLASVADLVDEIVIVTQPSPTGTWTNAAHSFGAKVVEFTWRDDFSAARNESLAHVTGEWVCYLDADEWLDDANRSRWRALRYQRPAANVVGYTLKQVSRDAAGRSRSLTQLRLFRNLQGLCWSYRVHEQISPALANCGGRIVHGDLEVLHDGYGDRAVVAAKARRNARLLALDLTDRPNDPVVLFHAGLVALDLKRPSQAVSLLERSRRLSSDSAARPPAEVLFGALARAYAQSGNVRSALTTLRQGLEMCSEDPELLFVEGTLLLRSGHHSIAEQHLRRVIELRPDHGPAWQTLTDLLLTRRRHADASLLADRLQNVPAMQVDAALSRARVELAMGEKAAAVETLESAIVHFPTAVPLQELNATVQLYLQDHVKATESLSQLLALDPDNAWASRTLAGLKPTVAIEPIPL